MRPTSSIDQARSFYFLPVSNLYGSFPNARIWMLTVYFPVIIILSGYLDDRHLVHLFDDGKSVLTFGVSLTDIWTYMIPNFFYCGSNKIFEIFENHRNHRTPGVFFFLMRPLAIKLLKLLISYHSPWPGSILRDVEISNIVVIPLLQDSAVGVDWWHRILVDKNISLLRIFWLSRGRLR